MNSLNPKDPLSLKVRKPVNLAVILRRRHNNIKHFLIPVHSPAKGIFAQSNFSWERFFNRKEFLNTTKLGYI